MNKKSQRQQRSCSVANQSPISQVDLAIQEKEQYVNLTRWFDHMQHYPGVRRHLPPVVVLRNRIYTSRHHWDPIRPSSVRLITTLLSPGPDLHELCSNIEEFFPSHHFSRFVLIFVIPAFMFPQFSVWGTKTLWREFWLIKIEFSSYSIKMSVFERMNLKQKGLFFCFNHTNIIYTKFYVLTRIQYCGTILVQDRETYCCVFVARLCRSWWSE